MAGNVKEDAEMGVVLYLDFIVPDISYEIYRNNLYYTDIGIHFYLAS